MGHLVADDEHSDPLAAERLLLRAPDPSAHGGEMGEQLLIGVDPMGDLLPRDDHDVTFGHRCHIEYGDADIVLVDEGAGNLSVDDLREQSGHVSFLLEGALGALGADGCANCPHRLPSAAATSSLKSRVLLRATCRPLTIVPPGAMANTARSATP